MAEKYRIRSGDTLRCAACGNKDFEERKHTSTGEAVPHLPYWLYICTRCGHVMSFTAQAEIKDTIL